MMAPDILGKCTLTLTHEQQFELRVQLIIMVDEGRRHIKHLIAKSVLPRHRIDEVGLPERLVDGGGLRCWVLPTLGAERVPARLV